MLDVLHAVCGPHGNRRLTGENPRLRGALLCRRGSLYGRLCAAVCPCPRCRGGPRGLGPSHQESRRCLQAAHAQHLLRQLPPPHRAGSDGEWTTALSVIGMVPLLPRWDLQLRQLMDRGARGRMWWHGGRQRKRHAAQCKAGAPPAAVPTAVVGLDYKESQLKRLLKRHPRMPRRVTVAWLPDTLRAGSGIGVLALFGNSRRRAEALRDVRRSEIE